MGRWTQWEGAEKLFLDEQRDKHQQRQNLRAKSGKGGSRAGTKKSMMPFELLNKEEQKKYTQAGEVRVYRMIMTFEEFKELDKEKRKEFLVDYLKDHSKTDLKNSWNGADIYYYLTQAGLHTPADTNRMTKKQRTAILLEKEREEIAASKEKLENDVIEAFTAAEDAQTAAKDAQRLIKSMRNELDVSKQSFIQSLDTAKKYMLQQQEHMKTELLMEMQQAINILSQDHAKEMQELREYANGLDDALTIQREELEKEITVLRSELHQTQTVIEDQQKDIEYYSNELIKLTKENDSDLKRLESKIDHAVNFNSVPQHIMPNNNNEMINRMKTIEIDVTLLKQLAIR
jgi:hypothetical protein